MLRARGISSTVSSKSIANWALPDGRARAPRSVSSSSSNVSLR